MTLGSHQQTIGKSQDHLTPRWIIDALGPFDLDPCASLHGLPCATNNIRLPEDGLRCAWPPGMFVWLNPPFDRYQVGEWIQRLITATVSPSFTLAPRRLGFARAGNKAARFCS